MTEQHVGNEAHPEMKLSPGQLLRQAREASGMSQQALADKIFLKIDVIEQLEADEVNPKASLTFTKGYIRLYAKNVGVDPEPILVEFDRLYAEDKTPQTLQSFSKRVSTEANDYRWMMVTYVILAIVIALVVLWWYQQPASTNSTINTVSIDFLSEPDTTEIERPAALSESKSINTISQASSELALDAPNLNSEATDDTDIVVPEDVQATAAVVIEKSELGSLELVFTFADDCWINIVDASGDAIAYGVKVKGRVMPVNGIPPFTVTLGAPQVVSILYAGNPVDMSVFPAGQTARFELPMRE
jgi:cytoskeleton protein RodZ